MRRLSRVDVKGLAYYVSSEGQNGQKIFMDDVDRLYFINLLRQQKIKSKLKFYGYVLLPKQYFLLMETSRSNLTRSIHQINSDYANYFNRRHKRKNKLFKDRYSCFIIEKNNCLAEVSCYFHLLPKKLGVAKSIFQYKWSSLPGYINKEKGEDWTDYDYILRMFNGKSKKACLSYKNHINKNLKRQISSPFKNLKGCIILGSEDFKEKVYKKQHLKEISHLRNEKVLAKKIIELVAQSPSWSSLKIKKRKFNQTILFRNTAIYFLKKYTDLSNQQISTYFSSLKKSSIAQMSRRFKLAKEKNKAVSKIYANLEKEIEPLAINKK